MHGCCIPAASRTCPPARTQTTMPSRTPMHTCIQPHPHTTKKHQQTRRHAGVQKAPTDAKTRMRAKRTNRRAGTHACKKHQQMRRHACVRKALQCALARPLAHKCTPYTCRTRSPARQCNMETRACEHPSTHDRTRTCTGTPPTRRGRPPAGMRRMRTGSMHCPAPAATGPAPGTPILAWQRRWQPGMRLRRTCGP